MDGTVIARGPTTVKLRFLQGIVGPTGPTGPTGPAGPANTLTIGTVTALAYGEDATASVTGTAPSQTLNLGLPMGAQGPSGSVSDGDKGDVVVSSAGTVWTVDANAIGDTKLRQGTALTVIGRSANSTGNVADIAAGTDGHVLRRSGTTLGFGTVANAGLDDMAATTLKGSIAGGAPQDLTPTQVRDALWPAGTIVGQAYAENASYSGPTTGIPYDDTIPTSSEGVEIISITYTMKSTTNRLRVRFKTQGSTNSAGYIIAALFDGGSAAIEVAANTFTAAGYIGPVVLESEFVPGTTSLKTYSIRIGPGGSATAAYVNGDSSARRFGGVSRATIVLEEIKA